MLPNRWLARKPVLSVAAFATVLLLARPATAAAQTVSWADLVGSWAKQGENKPAFTFRADSTALLTGHSSRGEGVVEARWQLIRDTIAYSKLVAKVGGAKQSIPDYRRLVKLEGKLLTITRFDPNDPFLNKGEKSRVYERIDSTQASPAKP